VSREKCLGFHKGTFNVARVLVVDDEPDIRNILRTFLEADGHEVLEAGDAAEAYKALDRLPDCIFLDVSMPGESGHQFLLKLRDHPELSRTPAMFVTAHADKVENIQGRGLAGPHIVAKPFRREQIVEAVHAMLRQQRRRLDLRVRVIRNALRATVDGEPRVAKNLSLGGLFVLSNRKRPIGDVAELVLHSRDQRIETKARVTHCRGDGIGFAFVSPGPRVLNAIAATIDDLLTDGACLGDRRRSSRMPVSAAIAFSDGKDRTLAQLRDISATGAYVITPDPPSLGGKVYIYLPGYTFSDGGRERSEVRGCLTEVVRLGNDGFGCRFREPSAEFVMAADDLMKTDGTAELVGM